MRHALAVLVLVLAVSGCSTERYANRIDDGPNSYVFARGHQPIISGDQLINLNVALEREFQIRESPLYDLGMFIAKSSGADPLLLSGIDIVMQVHDAAQDARWVRKGNSGFVERYVEQDRLRGMTVIHWTRVNIALAYADKTTIAEVYVVPLIENGALTNWWAIDKLTVVDVIATRSELSERH